MIDSATSFSAMPRNCIALSFDSNFFYQAKQCIRTIRRYCRQRADICALALKLNPDDRDWLESQGVIVRDDLGCLPHLNGMPIYGYAQVCRPFLRELFPGYDVYMWVDADIRFVGEEAFDVYLTHSLLPQNPVVICQKIDGSYAIVTCPDRVWGYHKMKNDRIQPVYGEKVAEQLRYFYNYNSGIWAMHRDSALWGLFKEALLCGLKHGFVHMREQDAMNVAILKWSQSPVLLPPTMNWLCGLSLPEFNPGRDRFVRPQYPNEPISVLHLIASDSQVDVNGETISWYELYQRLAFTE
jgi:lipopolysaccharide biosynthesis glycosyltransferase